MILQDRNNFFNTVNHDFKKINFSYGDWNNAAIFMFNSITKNDPIVECTQDVFNYLTEKSSYDKSLPLMSWRSYLTDEMLNKGYDPSIIYNHPNSLINFKKSTIGKRLNELNVQWKPKTVFTANEAMDNLKFPIIAKTDDSYQSKGVYRFNSVREMKEFKYLSDFKMFQEYKPLNEEFRLMLFKGKNSSMINCFMALSKKPISKKMQRIHQESKELVAETLVYENNFQEYLKDYSKSDFSVNKSAYSVPDFKWYYLDHKELFSKYSILNEISNTLFNLNPEMNFMALDVAMTSDDQIIFIESNKTPGMSYHSSMMLYKMIFEDYYQRPLNISSLQKLKEKSNSCKDIMKTFSNFNIDKNLIFESINVKIV